MNKWNFVSCHNIEDVINLHFAVVVVAAAVAQQFPQLLEALPQNTL